MRSPDNSNHRKRINPSVTNQNLFSVFYTGINIMGVLGYLNGSDGGLGDF